MGSPFDQPNQISRKTYRKANILTVNATRMYGNDCVNGLLQKGFRHVLHTIAPASVPLVVIMLSGLANKPAIEPHATRVRQHKGAV
jgi:hypothetical protein